MAIQTLDPLSREIPAWFDAAKLGIFVHWSPAAIPAFAPKVLLDDLPDDPDWVKAWRRLPFAEMYQNTMVVPGSATAATTRSSTASFRTTPSSSVSATR